MASACAAPDRGASDREALLALQALEMEAHLSYDAELLAEQMADTLVTLSGGSVTVQTRARASDRLASYLDAATFLEWSDVEPPVVDVAASGDLATVRVHRRVRLGSVDSAGRAVLEHAVFAWWETWRKRDDRWRLAGIATTDRPGTRHVAEAERAATLQPVDRTPAEILEAARRFVFGDSASGPESLRGFGFTADAHGPAGPFETTVTSEGSGALMLRQTTSRGERVRLSVGPLGEADAGRAFLQGHALLHLAADPVSVLGDPSGAGTIPFAGAAADVVRFRDGAGAPLDLVYDRRSGRLTGARVRNPEDPGGAILVYLSGWESTEGMRLPRRAVFLQGEEPYLYRIRDVEVTYR